MVESWETKWLFWFGLRSALGNGAEGPQSSPKHLTNFKELLVHDQRSHGFRVRAREKGRGRGPLKKMVLICVPLKNSFTHV